MPETRERNNSDKIKGTNRKRQSPVKQEVHRQMTVKLKKELLERKKHRDTGDNPDTTSEVQATEQVEESAYVASDRIGAFTSDGVSNAVTQHKEKQQERAQHTAPASSDAPQVDADTPAPSPPTAQEHMRQKAVGDMRTRQSDTGQEQLAPKTKQPADLIHERPMEITPGREQPPARSKVPKERQAETISIGEQHPIIKERPSQITPGREQPPARPQAPKERPTQNITSREQSIITPQTLKGRMQQAAIKKERTRRRDRQQEPFLPRDRAASPPLPDGAVQANTPPEHMGHTAAVPPTPQERMRQKAVEDTQIHHSKTGRTITDPGTDRPPISAPTIENKSLSPDGQSINPIKERPRPSQALKEKSAGGAFIPKTRQSTEASRTVVKATSTTATRKAAARPLEQAKRRVQRNAQRKLLQQSTRTTKAAIDLSRKAAVAVAKAVSSMTSAIAGLMSGTVLVPVICIIVFAAAIIASPFGILFSNEPSPGAMPLNVAIGQLNMELSNTLEALQDDSYSSIDIQGQGPDWREVVAVFSAKTAGAVDGLDVAVLTPDRVDLLRAVFWDMCAVSSEVETVDHPDSDPDDDTDDSWTEYILHITITAKTADDMRTEYAFTEDQNQALTELLAELATMEILLTDLSISEEKARDLLQNLPADLSPERRAVVETACKLVGKVSYFWGGKSRVIGWDSRWGTIQQVWAAGNSTTGTYRPYGLDCSGFVDWVFYNVSNGAYTIGHGGGAHAQHTYCTGITWTDAQPGDLVFYPGDSHVGIVGGWDADGNILIIHCASGQNNVVITGKVGFTAIGRPQYYSE